MSSGNNLNVYSIGTHLFGGVSIINLLKRVAHCFILRVYQLSVWDFAGQEEFYATHPCFISERAMYIAMYDASKGPQQLRTLKPWLTAIHSRATHCPVLVVGSHADLLDRYVVGNLTPVSLSIDPSYIPLLNHTINF